MKNYEIQYDELFGQGHKLPMMVRLQTESDDSAKMAFQKFKEANERKQASGQMGISVNRLTRINDDGTETILT
ncbi:MAG: hypothetical protein A2639_01815 [Candidatus Staskawiczbacteria bacterium RIFCSPHIGHO2_01_FULL_34_27]|uniref:Uncharacterized protein n=2 Tax=Candidatus Staskawicziibacteriota TaxID=1817916 RepID=A0A1G2HLG0_9BACT|nr:MAG: hypothetical protein A2639_01815 [Candidatus Staskawiczbacteria bacterium RIFCSPHIGHO2_01_FULL_34_27]OGZ69731.1 MAG: hypothetical protein A3D35_02065 [Candidatus Staskawiczbacteria bacterium RIFCSPHIGHO2_02_FULL_34_9]